MSPEEMVALVASANETKNFFGKILGPAIDELGLTLADNVKNWRFRNQIKNLEKVRKIAKEGGLSLKQVNLKVLVPYLENVSLEEDESLQDMWANLFTNYIDSSKNLTVTVYPSILSQLSTEEVRILRELDKMGWAVSYYDLYPDWDNKDKSALSNLLRLGLIKEVFKIEHSEREHHVIGKKVTVKEVSENKYDLTNFGQEFLKACKR